MAYLTATPADSGESESEHWHWHWPRHCASEPLARARVGYWALKSVCVRAFFVIRMLGGGVVTRHERKGPWRSSELPACPTIVRCAGRLPLQHELPQQCCFAARQRSSCCELCSAMRWCSEARGNGLRPGVCRAGLSPCVYSRPALPTRVCALFEYAGTEAAVGAACEIKRDLPAGGYVIEEQHARISAASRQVARRFQSGRQAGARYAPCWQTREAAEQASALARLRCGVQHAHRNTYANTCMHNHACMRTAHLLEAQVQKQAVM